MSLLYFQSHNAMYFNLEHITILFHAFFFPVCSTGLLCPFTFVFSSRAYSYYKQFCFDSYLYVKCGGAGGPCHCSGTLPLAEVVFFSPGVV